LVSCSTGLQLIFRWMEMKVGKNHRRNLLSNERVSPRCGDFRSLGGRFIGCSPVLEKLFI